MKGSKGVNAERTAFFCLSLKTDGAITSNPTQCMISGKNRVRVSTKFAGKEIVKSDTLTVIKLVALFVLPAVFGKIDFSFKDILLNAFFK